MICQCKTPDPAYPDDELLAIVDWGLGWRIIHINCGRLANPNYPTGPAWPLHLKAK